MPYAGSTTGCTTDDGLVARLRRLGRFLRRELWQQPMPHGLVSWRYLLPGQDERIRIHRRLWWQGRPHWPRSAWLLIETLLWIRWVGFSGWRTAWKAWRRNAGYARLRDEVSSARQARVLVSLVIGRCILPRDVYRFRLYRAPERAWDYVYDHEAAGYHHWRSLPLGDGDAARALLADKLKLGEVLADAGIPMVPTLACVPRGKDTDLSPRLVDCMRVFCKSRSGNRGIGAFTAWRYGDAIAGRGFDGTELPEREAVERAWRALLENGDALIQPCLANHPRLAPLTADEDAITVRYFSLCQGDDYGCLNATLEVPAGRDNKSGRPLYVILPIVPENGEIQPLPDGLLLNAEAEQQHAHVVAKLTDGMAVPDWRKLVEASHRAHAHCPQLWAVAWDWVVTPDGPRLLEGNSGWGTAMPQILHGGLLAAPS